MLEQHYNMRTAAEKLDISVKSLRRLIAAKQIPLYKVGNKCVIRDSDLEALPTRVYSIDEIADEMLRGDN